MPAALTEDVIKEIIGKRFGHWTVIGFSHKTRAGYYYYCKCDCGTVRAILKGKLLAGTTKSCGCKFKSNLIAAARLKHGHTNGRRKNASPTYSTWSSMLTRCYNKKCKSYKNYGGRGIIVCDRWHKFENFLEDMGEKPKKGMSIERLNNDGIYDPGNCVWADAKTQRRNNRSVYLNKDIATKLQSGDISIEDAVNLTGCSVRAAKAAKYPSSPNWKL